MSSLLDALKKLAMERSAASVAGADNTASARMPDPLPAELPADADRGSSQQSVMDGSLSGENSPVRPQPFLKEPNQLVGGHASRPIDGAAKSNAASHTSEQEVELYHQSVISQPMPRPIVKVDHALTAIDELSCAVQAAMDESPVELVESPFMQRVSGSPVAPQQHKEQPRDLSDSKRPDHPGQLDAAADLQTGTSSAPDRTMMAADIPDLWQVLARNSFDVQPARGDAASGDSDQVNDGADSDPVDESRSSDDARDADPPQTTPQAKIAQPSVYADQVDEAADTLRPCYAAVEQPQSIEQDAGARPEPSVGSDQTEQQTRAASGSADAVTEPASSVVLSSSVAAAVVPRKISAKVSAPGEFENLLQQMMLDDRQGPQLVRMYRRIRQLAPRSGSCGVIAVQRDSHVATLVGCVGYLHIAAGNHRVLLVDANADLRSLTEGFKLDHVAGLSDVCTGACSWKEAVHRTSTNRLSVMPVGTTMDLMADWSPVKSVLTEASKAYGLVLVDLGQAYGESAARVAEACDRLFMHVHLGKTHREMARNVADLLFSHNLTVSGVVVTNVSAGN